MSEATIDSFDLTLDLREFNTYVVQPLIDDEPIVREPDDDFAITDKSGQALEGPGPPATMWTGHGDTCWSDADPGL